MYDLPKPHWLLSYCQNQLVCWIMSCSFEGETFLLLVYTQLHNLYHWFSICFTFFFILFAIFLSMFLIYIVYRHFIIGVNQSAQFFFLKKKPLSILMISSTNLCKIQFYIICTDMLYMYMNYHYCYFWSVFISYYYGLLKSLISLPVLLMFMHLQQRWLFFFSRPISWSKNWIAQQYFNIDMNDNLIFIRKYILCVHVFVQDISHMMFMICYQNPNILNC